MQLSMTLVRQRENFEEKFISCDADGSGQKPGMKVSVVVIQWGQEQYNMTMDVKIGVYRRS